MGNTFGSISKTIAGGKQVWQRIDKQYPVGGNVKSLSAFNVGDIIGEGYMCIMDFDNKEVTLVAQPELFSATETYAEGDEVMYNGVVYKTKTGGHAAGAWDASDFTALAAGDDTYDELVKVNGLLRHDIHVDEYCTSVGGTATAGVVIAGTIMEGLLDQVIPNVVKANLTGILFI